MITLAGVLVPDQWKGNGEISGLALCTNDEQKYILRAQDREEALMLMLRQNIEISGFLQEGTEGKTILVTRFAPISGKDSL